MLLAENGMKDINFNLKDEFVSKYKWKQPSWGPIGYVVYKRTYARKTPDGKSEEWWQTCQRVVEGIFTIQKRHCTLNRIPWSELKARKSAERMYELMWGFKFTPSGRGIEFMGTKKMWDIGAGVLLNCAFISTEQINFEFAEPFLFMMDMSMLGVGVGFDTKGENKVTIKEPKLSEDTFVVGDSREGWVDLIKTLLHAFIGKDELPKNVDYSQVREKGQPLVGMGGVASGPEPLQELYDDLKAFLTEKIGEKLTSVDIVDVMNLIGRCVVSGGKRRTAQIALGEPDDEAFTDMKNPEKYEKELHHHRWASNNSVFATIGMDYEKLGNQTSKNGEPGYIWIDNIRKYGRMGDPINNKDYRVGGVNPCFTGDTIVAVADGRNGVSIKQLAEESKGQTFFPVYSSAFINYGNQFGTTDKFSHFKTEIHFAKAFKTGTRKVITVNLSDGSSFRCTPEHRLATKDGRWVEAQYAEGESLQQFYTFSNKNNNKSYRHINSTSNGYSKQYRMIWEFFNGEYDSEKYQINHKDSNAKNDALNNLELLSIEDHKNITKRNGADNPIHKCDSEYRSLYSKRTCIFANAKRYGWSQDRLEKSLKDFDKTYGNITREDKNTYLNNVVYVASVEWNDEVEDVYDLEVEDNHNFNIITFTDDDNYENCSGILVHNCAEQSLESWECCNLSETYLPKHDNVEEWIETLKFAYMYSKTVTLLPTHWSQTNSVMIRNRRIGTSVSGITQGFTKFGRRAVLGAMDKGYAETKRWDKVYSEWLGVPESIKKTSVKPSGTISLLVGCTPGIHYPYSEYYLRNVRIQDTSPLLEELKKSGYPVEKDVYSKNTYVVSFPVKEEFFDKCEKDVSLWEQLENAAQIQHYWADNQVSVTIKFQPKEQEDIKKALELYETRLKSVSFLPYKEHSYKQAPYISITKEEYDTLTENIKKVRVKADVRDLQEKGCDGETCSINL